ncbi:MAG TPA: alpha/beta hydrolase [Polyangiaceae bacterium]|nr:alpha/beta hydrolase [Polyangiaceae bacterium]
MSGWLEPTSSTSPARRRLPLIASGVSLLLAGFIAWRLQQVSTPKPFTREVVLSELATRYPSVSLPADRLPPGVVAQENLTFAPDTRPALALDVYRPAGETPLPAILLVHGGGWERGDRTMERPFAKRLAALGFIAVPVSYRLGPPGRFPNALFDLKAAVRWLRANAARFTLDPKRVGAVGMSAGGQLVALLGASNGVDRLEGPGGRQQQSSAVQAVVDIDGLVDFTENALLEKEEREPGAPTRFLGGPYLERATTWRDASAIFHVGPRSAPTLFINSTAPTPILPGRPEMLKKLIAEKVTARQVVIPDTPHPFWLLNPWFEPTLRAAAQFLREQLNASVEHEHQQEQHH